MRFFLNVLLNFLSVFGFGKNEEAKLQFVVVLYRHGHRSPMDVYPNDPFNDESYWPDGWAQLTNLGKSGQYKLGKWLRLRYDKFLPQKYNRNDIYVRSTDVDRTLMSAYCNLAGLYEPKKNNWNKNMKWQPIPVHTIPEELDQVLAMEKKCPAYDRLFDIWMEDSEVDEFEKNYANELNNMTDNCGFEKKYKEPLRQILKLHSVLTIESRRGFMLPDWTKNVFPEPLGKMAGFTFSASCRTIPLRRLKCGPLLKEILEIMDKKISGDLPQKMWMYSAHDNTLANLMMCLDVFDYRPPDFCDMLILELLEKQGTYYVSILHKTGDRLRMLKIPRCCKLCPLEKLKEISRPVIPTNWDAECV